MSNDRSVYARETTGFPRRWVEVASAADVQESSIVTARLGGREIVLTRLAGRVFAADAECPHRGGSLAEGRICDGNIRCPVHGYEYDLASGRGDGNDLTLETIAIREANEPPTSSEV